jgi:hypothetical protein
MEEVMPDDDDPLLELGMTREEVELWYDIANVAGRMRRLPEQHPMERGEMVTEFHAIQNRLLARVGVRSQRGFRPPAGLPDEA